MKRFLRGLSIFLALIGVGIVSAFAVVALLLRQEEVRVPDFTGQDIVTVIEALNQQGLLLKVDRRQPSSMVLRDTVISQTPAPGSGIKKGRQVHVVVSLGPSEMQAPKVSGEHFRKADITIRQAGFFPGTISRMSSETVEKDFVIAQNPQPGSPLDKGARISMLISTGKKQELLVMPKLTGKKSDEALVIIDRLGLQHRVSYKSSEGQSSTAERTVTRQKPGPGSPVPVDAIVELTVTR